MNFFGKKPFKYRVRRFCQVCATRILGYTFMSRVFFRIVMKSRLNLKEPKTFNEKIQWLKLYSYPKNQKVIQCADKYAVRAYLIERGFGRYLNELIGFWDRAEDIEWEKLPDRFAIKCNHGAAYNIICGDKATFDTKTAAKQLSHWLKEDFSLYNCEIHYHFVKRKVICEKYIETADGFFPVDYKFFCFNGVPRFVGVFVDRDVELHRVFLDIDWNPLPYARDSKNDRIPRKPECYEEMLSVAKALCKEFTFVRVDMYEMDKSVLFGELTFTPTGGLGDFFTPEADMEIGQMLDISLEMNEAKK